MTTPTRPRRFFMAWSARVARSFAAANLTPSSARPLRLAQRTDA